MNSSTEIDPGAHTRRGRSQAIFTEIACSYTSLESPSSSVRRNSLRSAFLGERPCPASGWLTTRPSGVDPHHDLRAEAGGLDTAQAEQK